jgi:hypothetical protein
MTALESEKSLFLRRMLVPLCIRFPTLVMRESVHLPSGIYM